MTSPIETPDQRRCVFRDSTAQEVADERAASKEAIQPIRVTNDRSVTVIDSC